MQAKRFFEKCSNHSSKKIWLFNYLLLNFAKNFTLSGFNSRSVKMLIEDNFLRNFQFI